MVVYTQLIVVVGVYGGMEGSISYIVMSTRETNHTLCNTHLRCLEYLVDSENQIFAFCENSYL